MSVADYWFIRVDESEPEVEEELEADIAAATVEFWYLLKPEPWMKESACRGQDPNIFFLKQGSNSRLAKKICSTCTVVEQCREYAEETDSEGIWAGEVRVAVKKSDVQDARPQVISIASRTGKDAERNPGFGTIAARRQTETFRLLDSSRRSLEG